MKFYCFEHTELYIPEIFSDLYDIDKQIIIKPKNLLELQYQFNHKNFIIQYKYNDEPKDYDELTQIHTDILFDPFNVQDNFDYIGDGWCGLLFPNAQYNRKLAIKTADCVCVTMVVEINSYILVAHVHCGWKGYVKGLHINALEKWKNLAKINNIDFNQILKRAEIHIASAIFGYTYECDKKVEQEITNFRLNKNTKVNENNQLLHKTLCNIKINNNKCYPDLQLLIARDLSNYGLNSQNISIFRENTYTSDLFISYRKFNEQKNDSERRVLTVLSKI